jgi:hypothetical protein
LSDAAAREGVRRTLAAGGRRLRAQRFLAELPLLLCAGLAGPVLVLLLSETGLRSGLAWLTPPLAAAALLWRALRPLPDARVAAWLDRRAGLADTLTTACWFLDNPPDDPWVRHQRRLAAEAGGELELGRLVSLRVPLVPAASSAVLALVVALGWALDGGAPPPGGAAVVAADAAAGSARTEPEESETAAGAELGRDALHDGLPVAADLEALAEELREGMSEELQERLRELAREVAAQRPPEGDASSGEGGGEAAAGEPASPEEMAAALSEAAEAAQRGDREAAADALEEAAEGARDERAADPEAPGQGQAGEQDPDAAKAPADAGVRWSLDALDAEGEEAEPGS